MNDYEGDQMEAMPYQESQVVGGQKRDDADSQRELNGLNDSAEQTENANENLESNLNELQNNIEKGSHDDDKIEGDKKVS